MHFDSSWIFLYDMWCYMHWRGNTNNWWLQIPKMLRITVCPVWKVQTKQNDFTYKLDNPQMVVVGGTLGGKLKLGWQFFMCHFKQSKPNSRVAIMSNPEFHCAQNVLMVSGSYGLKFLKTAGCRSGTLGHCAISKMATLAIGIIRKCPYLCYYHT